jgi:integrase
MDPRALLDDWLASSALRYTSRDAYRQEVTSWLDWCDKTWPRPGPPVNPLQAGLEEIARWAEDRHLAKHLDGRPFNGPDALAYLADEHPEVAKSHDRRITALTQYYTAAARYGAIRIAPDLTMLRSGVDRAEGAPQRLDPRERAVFLATVGGWGPANARNHVRDRLIAYLLLEGLRPSELIRVDMRHLYEQGDYGYEVRAPDEFENVGKQFVLEPLTGAALKEYLGVRPRPQDGVYALILGQGGRPIVSRYPNMIIGQICATHPILAQRVPRVTADTIAHTGFWDQPDKTDD